jgi:hypothetical protein
VELVGIGCLLAAGADDVNAVAATAVVDHTKNDNDNETHTDELHELREEERVTDIKRQR